MREILFRGKRFSTENDWYYGDLYHRNEEMLINSYYEGFNVSVIPETVGQYTGLTDKNGKKIFEGDIVKGTFLGFPMPLQNYVFTICWQEDVAGYRANYFENVEVIGNIHDNPELLEVSENA